MYLFFLFFFFCFKLHVTHITCLHLLVAWVFRQGFGERGEEKTLAKKGKKSENVLPSPLLLHFTSLYMAIVQYKMAKTSFLYVMILRGKCERWYKPFFFFFNYRLILFLEGARVYSKTGSASVTLLKHYEYNLEAQKKIKEEDKEDGANKMHSNSQYHHKCSITRDKR